MSRKLNAQLLIIDPQKDFMGNDDSSPYTERLDNGTVYQATLPVKGAVADMDRLAAMIDRIGHKLDSIHVTMDSHRLIDIAHPAMWENAQGKQPSPFTMITSHDIENGVWMPRNPNFRNRVLNYTRELEKAGKYTLFIWPPHCLISTWGHNVHSGLNDALQRWSEKEFATVEYVTKGSNIWTEHYGALMAEVPDPSDPGTDLNTNFLKMLSEADIIPIAGEALSHCVLTTVNQIADNIGADHIKKFHLLTDCMSPVAQAPGSPDFPAIGRDWLKAMEARGMTLTTSDKFLS